MRPVRCFDISLPPRRNDIAAMILLHSITGSAGDNRDRVLQEAHRCGRNMAEHSADQDVVPLLSVLGYEPRQTADRCIDLLNCPFHELAEEERDTVCAMNLAILRGITSVLPDQYDPIAEQRAGFCCVKLVPEKTSSDGSRRRSTSLASKDSRG